MKPMKYESKKDNVGFTEIKHYKPPHIDDDQLERVSTFFKSITYFQYDGVVYDVKHSTFEIKLFTNKYWKPHFIGTHENFAIFVNGQKLIDSKQIICIYKCTTCGSENTITNYSRLLSKMLVSTVLYCRHCIQKHNITLKHIRSLALKNKPKGTRFAKMHNKTLIAFNDMPKSWIDSYWCFHFSSDEFWKAIKDLGVVSINGITIEHIDEYVPYAPCYNAMQYAPMIRVKEKLYSIINVKCKCKICDSLFSIHWSKLEIQKRKTTNICRKCLKYYLANGTWKVRDYKNCNGKHITYQSLVEKHFIDFCNEHNIEVINGPILEYFWNNGIHHYHVDFEVPLLHRMIEIKAMHRFQKNDIASGKFQAKCLSANNEVLTGKYLSFEVLFDTDFTDIWKQ